MLNKRAASSEHAIAYGVSLLLSRTGMVSVGNLDERDYIQQQTPKTMSGYYNGENSISGKHDIKWSYASMNA